MKHTEREGYVGIDNQTLAVNFSLVQIIRVVGVGICLIGMFMGYHVIEQCWDLLDDQKLILSLQEKINEETNLDQYLNSPQIKDILSKSAEQVEHLIDKNSSPAESIPVSTNKTLEKEEIRLAYFFAWILSIILLSLIARISIWTITAGCKIALYKSEQHQQLKTLLRELLAEKSNQSGRF